MSEPPLPEPQLNGFWGWLAATVAAFILLGSIVIVFWLWCQDSADPPPGSLLPQPVDVTPTPQYATPQGFFYVRRT